MSLRRTLSRLGAVLVMAGALSGGQALAKKPPPKLKPKARIARVAPTRTTVVKDSGCIKSCDSHQGSCLSGCADAQCQHRCVNHYNDCVASCSKTVTEVVR